MKCEEIEEGSECPQEDCTGVMELAPSKNCSCHINPPCSSCVGAGYVCNTCGHETGDYEEPEMEEFVPLLSHPKYAPGSRRDSYTSTYTSGPFNSTPFTRCCKIAAVNEKRCPNCKAEITYHDDGLSELRRKVGPGNCLMCGQKRGNPAIAGNCCC